MKALRYFFCIVLPPVAAQASDSAADLPAAAALLCALVFASAWQQSRSIRNLYLAGLAAGLAAGSSLDILVFGPVILAVFLFGSRAGWLTRYRRRPHFHEPEEMKP